MKSCERVLFDCAKSILRSPCECECCHKKETLNDIMLMYDNGKIMCDKCAIDFYTGEFEI